MINIYWVADMFALIDEAQLCTAVIVHCIYIVIIMCFWGTSLLNYIMFIATFLCLCFRITEASPQKEKPIHAVSMFPWAQSCTRAVH